MPCGALPDFVSILVLKFIAAVASVYQEKKTIYCEIIYFRGA